jgi:DNA-binding MarR family transcriptional regulator
MAEINYKIEDTLDHLISTTIQNIKNSLFREFKAKNHNITTEQWSVLAKLHHEDGICQKQIADGLIKDKPTTTRILDLLEKKNLIIRISDDKDRRKFRVYLTHDGKNIVNELIPMAIEFQNRLKANLSLEELNKFTEILEKINKNTVVK